METCARCGQRIVRGIIPGNLRTWCSTETGAMCVYPGPGGEVLTGAHYPIIKVSR